MLLLLLAQSLYYILRHFRLKSRRKAIVELENRVNAVGSLPIDYRLGRVNSIVKNTPDLEPTAKEFEKRHETLTAKQTDHISVLMNEVDEQLYRGKMWGVKKKLSQLEEMIGTYEKEANELLVDIEKVTEVENIQRVQIIRVIEKYRSVQ